MLLVTVTIVLIIAVLHFTLGFNASFDMNYPTPDWERSASARAALSIAKFSAVAWCVREPPRRLSLPRVRLSRSPPLPTRDQGAPPLPP
jgi:hypothetical protein